METLDQVTGDKKNDEYRVGVGCEGCTGTGLRKSLSEELATAE